MGSEVLQRVRRLTLYLFISGGFNILLITLLFYVYFGERLPAIYFEAPTLNQSSLNQVVNERKTIEMIHRYRSLSRDQLIARLASTQYLENGFSQREIALACLVAFHHLDLSLALNGIQLPDPEKIDYGNRSNGSRIELPVYRNLSESQYEAIIRFAKMDRFQSKKQAASVILKKAVITKDLAPKNPNDETYVIQEGDSLWKIAKRFKTDIESIKAVNNLKTDTLRPGRSLVIPKGSDKERG